MYKSIDVNLLQEPRLKLNYADIRLMGIGHHPLTLIQMVMKYDQNLHELSALDLDDILENAEYICDNLGGVGIICNDLQPIAFDIFKITKRLTRVSDDILAEIVSLSLRKGLIRWLPKSNIQASLDKRSFPSLPFFACADVKNAVYPVDTPRRVIDSHNALHLAWTNRPSHGIVAAYLAQDFISMHRVIASKMQQFSIEHANIDFLDRLVCAVQGGNAGQNRSAPTNEEYNIDPEMTDIDEEHEIVNFLDALLTDHIVMLRNYISARDETNADLATELDGALDKNAYDLERIVNEELVTVDIDEARDKKKERAREFRNIWNKYLTAVKALVEGGDAINEGLAKSGLRNMLLIKDGLVSFFVSLSPKVATRADLDEQFTAWINHAYGYIDFRDNEDYTTSRAHLDDWLKAKTEISKIIGRWTVMTRRIEEHDMDKPKELDVDVVEESSQFPEMGHRTGGTQPGATQPYRPKPKNYWNEKTPTNPPAPLAPAQKEVNKIRKAVTAGQSLQDAAASSAATPPAVTPANASDPISAISYPVGSRRTSNIREMATGHRPHSSDCVPDYRTGKCYKSHDKK